MQMALPSPERMWHMEKQSKRLTAGNMLPKVTLSLYAPRNNIYPKNNFKAPLLELLILF